MTNQCLMFSTLREEQTVAVKGLKISSLGQEPQATVSVRKKDKCLVSNWIWLEPVESWGWPILVVICKWNWDRRP